MISPAELDEARDDLEAELVDVVSFAYRDGTTTDPDTLETVDNWVDRGPEVAALIVKSIQSERVVVTGEEPVVLRTYEVTVPLGTVAMIEDRVTVVSSHDPETQGATLKVKDVRHGSLSISRRILAQMEV